MQRFPALVGLLALVCFITGCSNTVPFKVNHDTLKPAPTLRTGTVGLPMMTDARSVTNSLQIGGQGAKRAYVAAQGRPVADLVTDAFAETLTKTGYQVVRDPATAPDKPILQGVIRKFWLSATAWKAVCEIEVELRLRKTSTGDVVWEKTLRAEEDDLMVIPNAMTAALNTLLKAAMAEFGSSPFAEASGAR